MCLVESLSHFLYSFQCSTSSCAMIFYMNYFTKQRLSRSWTVWCLQLKTASLLLDMLFMLVTPWVSQKSAFNIPEFLLCICCWRLASHPHRLSLTTWSFCQCGKCIRMKSYYEKVAKLALQGVCVHICQGKQHVGVESET